MFAHKKLHFTRSLPEGLVDGAEIDTSIQLILYEAEKIGLSWRIVPDTDVVQLTYKGITRSFRNRAPSTTHIPASKICQNKHTCKMILKEAGLNVMPGYIIYEKDSDERIRSMWDALNKPLVLKPSHGTHGDAIDIGLKNFDTCLKKIKSYFKHPLYEGGMILEEMFTGNEYRIMATSNRVLGILERIPAHVIGDGIHTVNELIQKENATPLRNVSVWLYPHIELDEISLELLKEQQLTPQSVPDANQYVKLKKVSNVMAGGIAIDKTDEAHDSVKEIALRAIQAIPGLSWGGVDFMTKNIHEKQQNDNYVVIEINPAPEFDMHDIPMHGKPRGVAKEFLYLMFPELPRS